jgi:XRE family transcriptional regulator, regulator of sulfur utilization
MSPDLLDTRLAEISERIRRGRVERGLTLIQLGEISGVAASTIQKIESRQMTPSITIILKIALGLGIEPGELIAPRDPSRLDVVVQREGRHARMANSKKLTSEKLSADIFGAELECWRIIMAPETTERLARPQTMTEQIIICERGEVELELDGMSYRLTAGDTLHCRSKTLYGLRNHGKTEASYLTAGRFPHSLHAELTNES